MLLQKKLFKHPLIKILTFISLLILASSHINNNTHPVKLIMKSHMDSSPNEAFKIWHYLHDKNSEYEIHSDEGLKKFQNFENNFHIVRNHHTRGTKSYSIGLNRFADLTIQEFRQKYLEGNKNVFKKIRDEKNEILFTKDKKNEMLKNYAEFWDLDLSEEKEDEYLDLFLKSEKFKTVQKKFGENDAQKSLQKNKQNLQHKTQKSLLFLEKNSQTDLYNIDWVEKAGLNTFVENQKNCGSCWAFATSQAVQAAYFIKTQKNISFSKQQLVDCEIKSHGCDGGMIHTAMDYIKENGIMSEQNYPYLEKKSDDNLNICKKINQEKIVTKISSYESCLEEETCMNDENLHSMLSKGPLAAVVDASEEFMLYEDGVFDKPCNEANHAILLVGYTQGGVDEDNYWVVKNSWGDLWGLHGYIKIKQSSDYNSCLLNTYYVRPQI